MLNFNVSMKELKTLQKWITEQTNHYKEEARLTYIFAPTEIGYNIKVVNQVSGEYIDITD